MHFAALNRLAAAFISVGAFAAYVIVLQQFAGVA
jgi:hypothetical protein